MTASHPYSGTLAEALDRAGNLLCVGIDPVLERLPSELAAGEPGEALERFGLGVVEAVTGLVGVVKPQSACFERFGSAGYRAMERVIGAARAAGLVVILDAKRGDIGSTAAHYAAGAAGLGAQAITVNAYMGRSAVEPFLDAGLGVHVLVRTSNPDSDEIQLERLESGGTLGQRMARLVHDLGGVSGSALGRVGAVVGATKDAAELAALRVLMPEAPVLVPGYGAQGGDLGAIAALRREGARSPGTAGVIVNASRSVLYPRAGVRDEPGSWIRGVAARARAHADAIGVLRG
ncbi:MAG: orotidine-5'-phosphate decarboxylase [Planctomycetota bacterium]